MSKTFDKKVSVVIPFYNAEHTLKRAVQSIVNQTYQNIEIILVNNNSTDSGREIAIGLCENDKRIIIVDENRQGVTYAANKGNSLVLGEYVSRMDADDFALPEKIEKQVDLLNSHPEIGVASCLVKHVGHHENTKGIQQFVKWTNQQQTPKKIELNQFIEAPVINPTVLFRKELLAKHGGYLHGDFPEDYELWLRWISEGVKVQKVPEVLFHWYDSDTRLTRNDDRYSVDAFYRTKSKYLVKWLIQQERQEIWVWGAGRVTRKRVEILQNEGIIVKGFIDVKKRELKDFLCVHYEEFDWNKDNFIVSYVGNWGARYNIREFLNSKGKKEGEDFILVA